MPDCFPYHQRDLEMFLYTLHYIGCRDPQEAHAKLLTMTEGRQCFTLNEVKEHFRKIEEKKFKVKEDGVVIFFTLPVLFMFYPGIRKHIIDYCDLADRFTLRKVCRDLRETMDTTQLNIQKVELNAQYSHKITLKIDEQHTVLYQTILEGVLVNNGARAKYLAGDRVNQLAINDLKSILENQKLRIEELVINISHQGEVGEDIEWKGDLEKVMKNLPAKPKVRRLTMGLSEESELDLVLPYLEPGCLEVIEFKKLKDLIFINSSKMENLEQWKQAKEFITDFVVFGKHVPSDFGHLDYVDVVMENRVNLVGLKELGELKDILLLRPNLQKFEILPTQNHNKLDPVFTTILPSFDPFKDKYFKDTYLFPYPNSSDKLTLSIFRDSIVFKGPRFSKDRISEETKQNVQRGMSYKIHHAYKVSMVPVEEKKDESSSSSSSSDDDEE
ncbi:unnamed protein product [Caenorhabditis brenneri]